MHEAPLDLTARDYEPLPEEELYHYCRWESLWAILNSRELWLTSFNTLNDSSEWRYGRDLLVNSLRQRGEFSQDFSIAVIARLAGAEQNLRPLVFSLSRNGDLLSQWRAYADDGTGVAVAFDAVATCATLPVNAKSVLYEPESQGRVVEESLRCFSKWWEKDKVGKQVVVDLLPNLAVDLLALKHPSFFEEQEVRLLHVVVRDGEGFSDPGGHTQRDPKTPGVEVLYREIRGQCEPYIGLPFDPPTLIKKIILGPKSPHSIDEVELKLEQAGLSEIGVDRSSCPYR